MGYRRAHSMRMVFKFALALLFISVAACSSTTAPSVRSSAQASTPTASSTLLATAVPTISPTPSPTPQATTAIVEADIYFATDETEGNRFPLVLPSGMYRAEWSAVRDEFSTCFFALFATYPDGDEAPVGGTFVEVLGDDSARFLATRQGTYTLNVTTDCPQWVLFVIREGDAP